MTHTASRKNPPAEALAQAGRESRRAYERNFHVPTQDEEDRCILQWGTDEAATRLALGIHMAHTAGCLGEEEIEAIAKKIQTYGDDRVADFQEELRRETE